MFKCFIVYIFNMKIYFAGSIRGGRDDSDIYNKLIDYLKKYGHVLTEHVGSKDLTERGEEDEPSDESIYSRDMKWIEEADVIVAEVTIPSLGVGYEIGKAEDMEKNILCLYRNNSSKKLSAMINGNPEIKIGFYEGLEDAKKIIDEFFEKL